MSLGLKGLMLHMQLTLVIVHSSGLTVVQLSFVINE